MPPRTTGYLRLSTAEIILLYAAVVIQSFLVPTVLLAAGAWGAYTVWTRL